MHLRPTVRKCSDLQIDVCRHLSHLGTVITNEILSDAFKNILTRLTTVLTNAIRQIEFYRELCFCDEQTVDTIKTSLLSV